MIENISQLKTSKAKRIFSVISFLLIVVEFGLMFSLHKYLDTTNPIVTILKEVLVNLTAASITAIILTGLVIFLIPIEDNIKQVEIIEPSKTKSLHDLALQNTDFWYHHGQIGRWVRTTAMPALEKTSIYKSITTDIKLIILNPLNSDVCNLYVEFRNRISFKENNLKTIEDLQAELLATIIIGQIFEQTSNGLNIQIYLDNKLTLVREDISSIAVFRTQIDPRSSALVYHNQNNGLKKAEYYNIAKTDFDFASRCCSRLLPNVQFPTNSGKPSLTTSSIKEYLTNINLLVKDDNKFLNNILHRVKSDYHPYN